MGKPRTKHTVAGADRELARLRRIAREAISLGEEANGDPSSCSYNVPIGDRLKDLRTELRGAK